MTEPVTSPFTAEQVVNLDAYQHACLAHPFTCGQRDDHPFHNGDQGILIPTVRGWICQFCDYTQDWAHAQMADGSYVKDLHEILGATSEKK